MFDIAADVYGEPHEICDKCSKCVLCQHCKCPDPPVREFIIGEMHGAVDHAGKHGRANIVGEDGKVQMRISIPKRDLNAYEIHPLRVRIYELEEALRMVTLPPYPDSDLRSLLETLAKMAKAVLEKNAMMTESTSTPFPITVNGVTKEINQRIFSFLEVVRLEYPKLDAQSATGISVMYKQGPRSNPEGILGVGEIIVVQPGMKFTIAHTGNA